MGTALRTSFLCRAVTLMSSGISQELQLARFNLWKHSGTPRLCIYVPLYKHTIGGLTVLGGTSLPPKYTDGMKAGA